MNKLKIIQVFLKRTIGIILLCFCLDNAYSQESPNSPEYKAGKYSAVLSANLNLTGIQEKKVFELTLKQQNDKNALIAKYGKNKDMGNKELIELKNIYDNDLKKILSPEQFTKWQIIKNDVRTKNSSLSNNH